MPIARSQILSTVALTLGCVAVYVGLRLVPVEPCEFMHYGDFLTEDGVIEGCGYEEIGFFDLNELRFPLIAEVVPMTPARQGEPSLFQLKLRTSTGRPVSYPDLAVSHTERLHTMVVDPTLGDYHHLHPTDGGAPGLYQFEFTPQSTGVYQVFLDFIPLQTSRRTLVATSFEVSGEAPSTVPVQTESLSYDTGEFAFRLVPEDGQGFRVGTETRFTLEVTGDASTPLVFDPVMDSFAHIVAFAPGRRGFAHFHPLNAFINTQDPRNPELEFAFSVDRPGHYRVWAQLSINGVEKFIPFDLQVAEG